MASCSRRSLARLMLSYVNRWHSLAGRVDRSAQLQTKSRPEHEFRSPWVQVQPFAPTTPPNFPSDPNLVGKSVDGLLARGVYDFLISSLTQLTAPVMAAKPATNLHLSTAKASTPAAGSSDGSAHPIAATASQHVPDVYSYTIITLSEH